MEPEKLDRIIDLLFKQKVDKLSPSEQDELDRWKKETSANLSLSDQLRDEVLFAEELALYKQFDGEKALNRFKADNLIERHSVFKRLWKYTAAAVVLIGVTVGIWYIKLDKQDMKATEQAVIVPGGNRAALVLENGEQILLHESEEGIVFGDSVYYEDGKAVAKVAPSQWLTVVTPRGGTYKMTLADGTKVWLNSDSKFKYQRGQVGGERKVFLDGEAYFEVASKRRSSVSNRDYIPFRVISGIQEVLVLGTTFNVMGYAADNSVETTLLEGKVNVYGIGNMKGQSTLLAPGQQSVLTRKGQLLVKEVDVEPYVAWKDGRFQFESQKLVDIMNTLARWYDIEVVFDSDKKNVLFTGSMDRNASFNDILEKIGGTKQVSFRIEGRRVIVM